MLKAALRKPSRNHITKKESPFMAAARILKEIPTLAIWNIVLAIGGTILVMFFGSIGFIPDFDIQSLLGTIAAIAGVTVFVILYLGYCLLLPAWSFSIPKIRSPLAAKFYGSELVLGVSVSYIAMLGLVIAFGEYKLEIAVALVFAVLIAIVFAVLILKTRKDIGVQKLTEVMEASLRRISWRLMWWFWWAFFFILFLMLMETGEKPIMQSILFMFLLPVVFGMFSIGINALPLKQKCWLTLFGSVFGIVFLGLAINNTTVLPRAAVYWLGLSSGEKEVTLVLSESGCNAVNASTEESYCELDTDTKQGVIEGARIESRIGLQFVIHVKSIDSKEKDHRIIIPKEHVIAWSYENKLPPEKVAKKDPP
jgi:hypothetical protein